MLNRIFGWVRGSIRNKLMAAFSLLALVPLLILSAVAYRSAEAGLRERAFGQLESVATLQKERLLNLYIRQYGGAVASIAGSDDVIQRVKELEAAGADRAKLQGELKSRLDTQIKGLPGVFNAHLLDAKGIVIADTLPKGKDQIGQNKATDPYFTGALADKGKLYIKPIYKSSSGNIGAAVSITMADPDTGKVFAVAVVRVTDDEISHILTERTGMGETGESYLVTTAKLMGSESRFEKGTTLARTVDTEGVRRALDKKSGAAVYPDYRSTPVLGYYTWLPELNMGLLSEIDEQEAFATIYRLRWTVAITVLVTLVLVVGAGFWLARGLTRQVNKIMETFSHIGMGDFTARAAVVSADELGSMASSLNAMFDNILGLMQSSEEKEQIQKSIGKLLEEVAGVADGDLTKDAEVTTDMTGAIADSFNYMIEQLRKIIGNVQDATLQVSSSANEIHATTEHLAQGSEAQAEQIVNTSAAIDEMAVSIQQVSENAALSATVAQQSLANAKTGNDAVQNTIQGMNRIRDQVQETAKRIKRLGESSQEIGQIIQLIDDIADRTSILALNASIQAAMAGEAGRGFAVVAEEVERLAIRSTDATKKIATLVKTIQSETNEAVGAMEKGIQEVVEGSKLAGEAGHALGEIQGVSNRLAELIQSISLASKQQARGSEALAKSMGEISQITQQTAAGTKQAAESVNELAGLADGLRSSVSTFRLPSTNGNGHGPAPAKPAEPKAKGKEDKPEKRRRELARA